MLGSTSWHRRFRVKLALATITVAAMLLGAGMPLEAASGQALPVTSTEDVTPPQALDLVVTPTTVDVTGDQYKRIEGTITATDDLSGVDYIMVSYHLADRSAPGLGFGFTRVSGDARNGVYAGSMNVFNYQTAGTYLPSSLYISDAVGNYRLYRPEEVQGFTPLTVKSDATGLAPEVTSLTFTPQTIDVTDARRYVAFEAVMNSDVYASVSGQFTSPSGNQTFYFGATSNGRPPLVDGTATLDRYSEPGDWKLTRLCSSDQWRHEKCFDRFTTPTVFEAFPATLKVVSNAVDTVKPEVTAVRLSTGSIDVTGGPQTVKVAFDVADDLSGVFQVSAMFESPVTVGASPEVMHRTASAYAPQLYPWVIVNGSYYPSEDDSNRLRSGTLEGTVTFPQHDRSGEWRLFQVCIADNRGWSRCYYPWTVPSVDTLGPTKLTVRWNRPPTVKVIGVSQSVYPERSQPAPACEVRDHEDGVVADVKPNVVREGDNVTVTCTYTDQGLPGGVAKQTASASAVYTVERSTNTPPKVQVAGVLQASYEVGSEPAAACSVEDAEDASESAAPQLAALSGPLAAYGAGSRTVTCSYTDAGGLTGTHSATYSVVDTGKPNLSGQATTQPNAAGWYNSGVTIRWTARDSGVGIDPAGIPADHVLTASGKEQTATASVSDRAGHSASATSSPAVNIDRIAPTVDAPSAGPNPKAVNQTSTLTVSAGDGLSGIVAGEYFLDGDPGEGKGLAMTLANGALSATIGTGLAAGVYDLGLRAVDAAGNWSPVASTYLVVYDPNAGFVTGGGRISSPAGAYAADPTRTGQAAFGFVSKYQKGAKVPTGNTEFQFQAAGLNFSSSSYDWLVVSGARAQFKGEGTVNGKSGYTFLLTAVDGQVNGGGGVDKFRIKILGPGGVVYDNGLGAPDDGPAGQAVTGGSISIHA